MRGRFGLLLAASLTPALALAHPGDMHVSGFVAGLSHPWTGLDHMAAMLAAGLWAGGMRRPRFAMLLLAATVVGIICGTLLGVFADVLTSAERMVALSAVALGVLAMTAVEPLRLSLVAALVALFCSFHGYVHAIETPRQLAQLDFTSGFVVSMLLLQIAGALLAAKLLRGPLAVRGAGACCAVAGLVSFLSA
jgi:urease accessory protein